jgi:hypothetical protein
VKLKQAAESIEKIKNSSWNAFVQRVNADGIVLQLHRDQVSQLNRDLVGMNIDVTALQPRNSLEEYFLSLTGTNQHVAAFTN